MSKKPETDDAAPAGDLVRLSTQAAVEGSLRLTQLLADNYVSYKKALELALDNFLSKADLARVQAIQSELLQLASTLDDEAGVPDHELVRRISLRTLELANDLHRISGHSTVSEIATPGLMLYNQYEILASDEYAKLSASEAISLFPKIVLSLMLMTIGFYVARFLPIIRAAFAADPANSHAQAIDVAIYVFLLMLVILQSTLIYAGFFAKTKSKQAAQTVFHFFSFFGGAFLGFLAKLNGGGA